MGRGKFRNKPTGKRQSSTPEEMQVEHEVEEPEGKSREGSEEGFEEESEGNNEKRKGTLGIIQIENPNLVKPKSLKARDLDLGKTTELSRREREESEKQKAHERHMKLQEQGKTEQARKDLGLNKGIDESLKERLSLIRQQRAEAAKKREEEKAAKELKKAEARK